MLTPQLLSKFYSQESAQIRPKYFDLFNSSNLSKLEHAIKTRLVFLMPGKDNSWHKVHDKRVYDRLQNSDNKWDVLYYVLEHKQGCWHLYELTTLADRQTYVQLMSETDFFEPKTMQVARKGDCLIQTISKVLGVSLGRTQLDHQHSPTCLTLRELVFAKSKNSVARDVGAEFLLASHLRCVPRSRERQRKYVKNNVFGVHSVFAFSEGSQGLKGMPVICVTKDLRFYLLLETYSVGVRAVQTRQRHPKAEAFPSPADKLAGKPTSHMSEQEMQRAGIIHQVETCPCTGCKNAKLYEHNMSKNGPQIPFKCDLSSFDLFSLLGANSPQVQKNLMRVASLSIGSFDVESVATRVQDDVGNEDLNFRPETVSNQRLPRQVQAVHQPCRIGFVDQLRMETERPTLIFRYDPEQPEKMIGDFVEALFEHRDAAAIEKMGILFPYFEWLDKYKKAHFSFYQRKGYLPPNYCERWQDFKPTDDEEDDDDLDRLERETVEDLAEQLGQEGPSSGRPLSPFAPDVDEDVDAATDAEDDGLASAARKAKKKRDAQRICNIERAWEHGIFGLLEKKLRTLMATYVAYGFNA
jgi:hypothetical protein